MEEETWQKMEEETWRTSVCPSVLPLLKICATLAGSALNLTPLMTAYTMSLRGTVGKVSPVPFLMVSFNGFCWSIYGSVLRNWFPLVAANAVGASTGLAALCVYASYARDERARQLLTFLIATTFGVIGFTRDALVDPLLAPLTQMRLGTLCVFVTVLMFASPLVTVKEVLRTRSAASMSLPMTIASLTSCSFWLGFGTCVNDVFIYFPNIAGLILSALQLALFAKFGTPKRNVSDDEEEDLQLLSEDGKALPTTKRPSKDPSPRITSTATAMLGHRSPPKDIDVRNY